VTNFEDIEIPYLFDGLSEKGHYLAKRDFVEQRLIELLQDDQLCVTWIMNQDMAVTQLAGEIIAGVIYDSDGSQYGRQGQNTNAPIPGELLDVTVDIVSVDGKRTVSYVDGVRRYSTRRAGRTTLQGETQPQTYPNVVDTGSTRAQLRLRQAWLALKQYGAWCRVAAIDADQVELWRYREVSDMLPPLPPAKKAK